MRKLHNIIHYSVALILFVSFFAGCSNEQNKDAALHTSTEDSAPISEANTESETSTESERTTLESSSDHPGESSSKSESSPSTEHHQTSGEESLSEDGTDNQIGKEKNNNNKSDVQMKENHSDSQTVALNNDLRTDTPTETQDKAVSIVKDYLRSKDELIEDKDHFVGYDGQINDYVIIRYSTLFSGRSATIGRYGVNIHTWNIATDPGILFP
ncbi:hypothetical protein [Bacillus sp. KH172YL63]|uniref:hypothetical protein n=1 Tax=Bacillus sp. KH172YL63 TaxID=2709784 RepID=UPI0013E4A9CA|nr:hypothetical protein [Bacillus sp. KH172YL63]BCB04478.1 hypothetical protein KH172YL63_26110 [Bacillus sp. KH172YL63]